MKAFLALFFLNSVVINILVKLVNGVYNIPKKNDKKNQKVFMKNDL